MKTFAKVTMDSLKAYSETVQRVEQFSSVATSAISDFDNLISSISVEIEKLEEKKGQLVEAKSVIENKITEYETKIEETKSYISEKESDLNNTKSELESTSETFTIYWDGDLHEIPNPSYSALEIKMADIEALLAKAHVELNSWESRLSKCHAVERELTSVLSSIASRISELNNNKMRVGTNKNEYGSAVTSIKNHSSHAVSLLSKAELSLNMYIGICLKVISAFEAVKCEGGSRNLNDLAYLSSKFKNAPSRRSHHGKNTSFREDGHVYHTDDNGNIYRCDNELEPNIEYVINGYKYKTDKLGRVISAEGVVHPKTHEGRLDIKDSKGTISHGDAKETDERGHIIGDQLDGSNGMENIVAQDADINGGDYKNLEDSLAKAVKEGHDVVIKVEPIYGDKESYRPTTIIYTYIKDGEKNIHFFPNGR